MATSNIAAERRGMTRRTLSIIGVLTAIILGFVLFSSHGLIARLRLSADASSLQSEISSMKATEDSLRAVIHTLETDTLEIERIARERYGYVRPGEQVYIIDRDTSS